jgi:hypothetical protein
MCAIDSKVTNDKHGAHFKIVQESRRKEIERTFGALKAKFPVLRLGVHGFDLQHCEQLIQTCMIFYNWGKELKLRDRGITCYEPQAGDDAAQPSHGQIHLHPTSQDPEKPQIQNRSS